jgi:hypothetical protein
MQFVPGPGSKLKNWWSKVSGTKRVYRHPRPVNPYEGQFFPAPAYAPAYAQPQPINRNNTRRLSNQRRQSRRISNQQSENINEEDTLEWRIAHNPNIQLTNSEYRSLSPNLKRLGWTNEMVQTGFQEYEPKWRRRTAENIRRNLERSLNWRITHDPSILLTKEQYRGLTPAQKNLGWERTSVQVSINEFENRWKRA